jgi:drug/metabolite transporter (DMT)-like permease
VATATLLALAAAVLHAGWNLVAKRAADPLVALWGQFAVAGAIGIVVVLATGGVPPGAWSWAFASGAFHVPYVAGLAWAYRHGDFSLAYPLARGGGALVAAAGGVVLLDDDLSVLAIVAVVIVVAGMASLAVGADLSHVVAALVVATAIGGYTLCDSRGIRSTTGVGYLFATQIAAGVAATACGLGGRRARAFRAALPYAWRSMTAAGVLTVAAYGLVLLAVRRAPVGYVAALRESSVLIAVALGVRVLGEGRGRLRTGAATLIVGGLVLLVAAR